MKRVKHFTAFNPNTGITIKLTMEVSTSKNSNWMRSMFIATVDNFAHRAMLGLSELGFPLTKIKMK
jgi:hypothetical protein